MPCACDSASCLHVYALEHKLQFTRLHRAYYINEASREPACTARLARHVVQFSVHIPAADVEHLALIRQRQDDGATQESEVVDKQAKPHLPNFCHES